MRNKCETVAMSMLQDIRTKYPNPRKFPGNWYGLDENGIPIGYCVGGALCLASGLEVPFPITDELRAILMKQATKVVNKADVRWLCAYLIKCNDALQFDRAWEVAAELFEMLGIGE